jgi:hypothetical protein
VPPLDDVALFGDFKLDEELQQAAEDTIREWIKTYLAVVERRVGLNPGTLPLPKSYVWSDDGALSKKPEDQLPCIVILAPGTGKTQIVEDGEGNHRGGVVMNVAVIVEANSQAAASRLAKRYRKALELLLVHQPSLGGFASGLLFRGWRNDDLRPEDSRSIATGTNVVEVLVPNISKAGAGLKAPLEEPYEETKAPTVKSPVDVDLESEEAA